MACFPNPSEQRDQSTTKQQPNSAQSLCEPNFDESVLDLEVDWTCLISIGFMIGEQFIHLTCCSLQWAVQACRFSHRLQQPHELGGASQSMKRPPVMTSGHSRQGGNAHRRACLSIVFKLIPRVSKYPRLNCEVQCVPRLHSARPHTLPQRSLQDEDLASRLRF